MMETHTITLDLPTDIYRRAAQLARSTDRSIEELVLDWLRTTMNDAPTELETEELNLEALSSEELIQIAYKRTAEEEAARLQTLLEAQHERPLTIAERNEATYLVEQEDLLTLKKARAIYLLKQRHALPDQLKTILAK
jgi:hypothetical protein